MERVYLDCSGLKDIRLHSDLPNSIYIDGQQFINNLNDALGRIEPTFIKIEHIIIFSKPKNETKEAIINKSEIAEINSNRVIMKNGNTYHLTEDSRIELLKYF